MKQRLTLDDIGELAGVSRSTVSRVINNQPNVKEEVRERVKAIIAETGYIPNPAARSLAVQRSGIIGLVIPRSIATFFGDPYFSQLTQGITKACYENGYILSLFFFFSQKDEERYLPRITQRSFIDGIIVQATTDDDPIIPQLVKTTMPFLVVGRLNQMPPDVNYIDVDNINGARKAVLHLIHLGNQRIAHLSGSLENRAGLDRKRGYEIALGEENLELDEDLIVAGDFTQEGGYRAMKRVLPFEPDAVFAASDTMAIGALEAIRDAGLRVPEDIAVVGFDDLPPSRSVTPKLTTVKQPIHQFGENAVAVLMDIIQNGSQPLRQKVYPTELIIRESCGEWLI